MLWEKEIISINGKMRAVSVFITHQLRIMENTLREMHAEMLILPIYIEFRATHMTRNPRLAADWQVINV